MGSEGRRLGTGIRKGGGGKPQARISKTASLGYDAIAAGRPRHSLAPLPLEPSSFGGKLGRSLSSSNRPSTSSSSSLKFAEPSKMSQAIKLRRQVEMSSSYRQEEEEEDWFAILERRISMQREELKQHRANIQSTIDQDVMSLQERVNQDREEMQDIYSRCSDLLPPNSSSSSSFSSHCPLSPPPLHPCIPSAALLTVQQLPAGDGRAGMVERTAVRFEDASGRNCIAASCE
eukprot:762682-Hanusia_phi.AAC.5